MSEHAFLAPSSAHRWVHCARAPSLEAAYPETEPSIDALEGTAAHWVVEMRLRNAPVSIGAQAPNGIAVTAEMIEASAVVYADIIKVLGFNWHQRLFIETPVQIPRVHAKNWGTPDYRAWTQLVDGSLSLTVWDFKYGYGIHEAFENWQLIDYVAGCLSEAKIDGLQEQNVIVDMRVIQPRAFHRDGPVRNWQVRASDLRGYFNRLEMGAEDATSLTPTATPHPDACKNCKGRHACEALQRSAYASAERGQHYAALDLPPHALGLELKALKKAQALLDARVSGLETEVTAKLKQGIPIPFWSLESTPGRLNWVKPASEVAAVGQMLGITLTKEPDVITPTQAKAAGVPESIINLYATRPSGAVKLTFDNGSKAHLTFAISVA